MKDINSYINESSNVWKYFSSVSDSSHSGIKLSSLENKDAKWLYIDMNNQMITPYTEDDVKQATKDLEDNNLEEELHKLKIGNSYNYEGNIYLRIK